MGTNICNAKEEENIDDREGEEKEGKLVANKTGIKVLRKKNKRKILGRCKSE